MIRPARPLAVLFGLVTVGAWCLPLPGATAATVTQTASVRPSVEAWFHAQPTCALPAGCAPTAAAGEASPYTAGTMHVGSSVGQETARSYFGFPATARPDDAVIVAATLEVPVHPDGTEGAANSAAAKLVVCPAKEPLLGAEEGSFSSPPAVDCGKAVTARFVPLPTPHLSVNLQPLLPILGETEAFTLLPDPAAADEAGTWHLAYDGAARQGGKPLVLSVTYTVEVLDGRPDTAVPVDNAPTDVVSGLPPVEPAGGGEAFAPRPAPPVVSGLPGGVTAPVTPVLAPTLQGASVDRGFKHREVFLLPLLLLLIPVIGRGLCQPVLVSERAAKRA